MRSLFWKMFFGAWITAMVMVVAAIYITHFGEFGDPRHEERWEGPALYREVVRNLRGARRHGQEYFQQWLERQPKKVKEQVFAVDQFGRELLGRPLPEDMAPMLIALNYRNRESHAQVDKKPAVGFFLPLRDNDNLRVVMITGQSKETLLLRFLWRNFWPMLLLSMLASGAASYWLARYLSRPLEQLRAATRRVAAGELDYRVSPGLHSRSGELADLARDFDSMTAQLQESMAEQRRLIKDVSHELRSPLARLQVALGIARQKNIRGLDAELDKIGKAADYLEEIIADVLSLPVTAQDQRPLDDVVEINSLAQALQEELKAEAEEKQLSFAFKASNGELLVATRGSSLTAALENILRNAIKYSPHGGNVRIAIDDLGEECRIRVTDSGNGVPEDELQAIFRPFYRTDSARTRESGGIGLGLAIAQRTIVQHGGNIQAYNTPSSGLCVEIQLPVLAVGE
ncbi:ATP-binding protein [Microbulbifer thermotolerans]|uniref:histidine kinase n=1 Tax=Microbulbifer thermotolerans TaxID=252514 RepID=A0A143HL37_MICTH|nr:ATP-binding protein [Microbulbifer thermotolerans]AMX02206.1 two-component sensor histidine kinase [Microbulbifer thermotolerans]MCX2778820.1 ATP-binding protein [Microbulbifer thermotolerans]MCX2781908.1 ATP-binding protein [Microbulbifer thermotolerans]MCX2793706.1 ATP-binding protein [Microbulbifer thermotolerans]MCX2800890.1 ATP-binding protein [Microbulbifer thermotolerans]